MTKIRKIPKIAFLRKNPVDLRKIPQSRISRVTSLRSNQDLSHSRTCESIDSDAVMFASPGYVAKAAAQGRRNRVGGDLK